VQRWNDSGLAVLNGTDERNWNMSGSSIENDDWVLIVDATMLVSPFVYPSFDPFVPDYILV